MGFRLELYCLEILGRALPDHWVLSRAFRVNGAFVGVPAVVSLHTGSYL